MKRIRRVPRTRTYYKRLAAVFTPDELEMHAQMVRLVVLYEDLKIELRAASRKKTFLDFAGSQFRRFYFVRATLQTLREAHSAIVKLNECPAFHRVVGAMEHDVKTNWKAATEFFQTNAPTIRAHRNRVGGHFSRSAALHVVRNMEQELTGRIELKVNSRRTGAGATFHFAYDLVAGALLADRGEQELQPYVRTLFEMLRDGYVHLTNAVTCIAVSYLIPRFEGRR